MFNFARNLLLLTLLQLGGAPAWADDSLRDPTRPPNAVARPSAYSPVFSVSAVFVSETRRVAIVNGKAVGVGDRIGGATVRHIDDGGVKLIYRGQTVVAGLQKTRIRE